MPLPPTPDPPASPTPPAAGPPRRSAIWRGIGIAALALAACGTLGVLLWDWNWFRPLVEAQSSAALGRKVTLEGLEVHPGRRTLIIAHGVRVANPEGFEGPDLAVFPRLRVTFDAETWVRTRQIVLPLAEAERPGYSFVQKPDGQNNWTLKVLPSLDADPAAPPPVVVGDLVINGGTGRVQLARVGADMEVNISTGTEGGAEGATRTLVIDAKGSYAKLPITIHAVGGSLLSLSDTTLPYAVDLTVANGPTRITLKGTLRNPTALAGADLDMVLTGPDMALLLPLTGIPIPKTPSYEVAGKLGFGEGLIRFTAIKGRVGSSDLHGALEIDPRPDRPVVSGALTSRRVDLEDLAGFIGSEPGRTTTPGQTAAQVQNVQRAEDNPKLLPTTPINLPRVREADIHITYVGASVLGRNVPFNTFSTRLDIDDGHIRLTDLKLGVGGGTIAGTVDLNPVGDALDADAHVTLNRVNLGPLLQAAGWGSGNGPIDGEAKLKGRGASLSAIVAQGDGMLRVVMAKGGEINALLLDLSGVQLGRALLSAIGIPEKEHVVCMLADFTLRRGVLTSRTLVVDTTDHVITAGGTIDLAREQMEMRVRTLAKRLSIGTLAAPILIRGPFKDLRYLPDAEFAARAGAAVGLGLLFPPAALLPMIHLGVGDVAPCAEVRN